MNDDLVIDVKNVSKAYPLYAKPIDMLKELVFGGVRHDLFWALRDVSFSVRAGDRLGIVGPNGAGKSTLLQIIAGNLNPTSGSVLVNGSISALLSLVPAWNVEQTGMENIRFNLLMRGCSTTMISQLTEDIVDFAELGQFIHQPVKTYSSGMSARLSFSIATTISPEILIVDEVLGAGDGYFAGKATKRMQEMCDKGKALLFVSHSTAAVRQMCNKAIWMESGGIRFSGAVDYVTTKYDEDMIRSDEETTRVGNIRRMRETMHLVSPEDICEHDICRIRIREQLKPAVTKTYYIRDIYLQNCDEQSSQQKIPVSLEAVDIRMDENMATLEVQGCEWGRVYSRNGLDVRVLSPRTGSRKGGHILLRRPLSYLTRDWPVIIAFSVEDTSPGEDLCIDYLDVMSCQWRMFEVISRERLSNGWLRVAAKGNLTKTDEATCSRAVSTALNQNLPVVEIRDVYLMTTQGRLTTVLEGEPFKLVVEIECYEVVVVSVNINIVRSDGVYVFYQPSGLTDVHANGFGHFLVEFDFANNYFGSGYYEINVFACNEWSWENIPPSEIFDKKLGVYKFSVKNVTPIEFGLIHTQVPVRISSKRIIKI